MKNFKRTTTPIFHRAFHFNRPVEIRAELEETDSCIADMLRYDLAFQHPTDPSLIVMPVFKTPHGNLCEQITFGRWQSFSTRLEVIKDETTLDTLRFSDDWFTYVHENSRSITRKTFSEFMKSNPKYKIVGYRSFE